MKRKIKKIIVILMLLAITTNVQAITSNDVTYDNNGTTENLTESLDTLYNELKKYKTGGSVEANQMLAGVSGYSKGVLVTGTIPSKGAATYTPGTTNQTIASGQYLSGTQTIVGDTDLNAENIKSGIDLFGIEGTYTSDATATASDILSGKTAYVNGTKVTGTLVQITNNSIGLIAENGMGLRGENASVSITYNNLVVGAYYMVIPTIVPRRTNCGWSGGSSTTFNLSGGNIINRTLTGQYSVQQYGSSDAMYFMIVPAFFVTTSSTVSITYYPAIQTCKGYGGKWLLYRIR